MFACISNSNSEMMFFLWVYLHSRKHRLDNGLVRDGDRRSHRLSVVQLKRDERLRSVGDETKDNNRAT